MVELLGRSLRFLILVVLAHGRKLDIAFTALFLVYAVMATSIATFVVACFFGVSAAFDLTARCLRCDFGRR